jgi:hypothetical protein
MNPYQGAISAVGRILAEFDTNKRYPVYGFGAKVRRSVLFACLCCPRG